MENNNLLTFDMSKIMQKNKKDYISPALTVVSFRAERGFANSVNGWQAQNQKLKELDQSLQMELNAGNNENNWYGQPVAGYFENDDNSTDLSGGWGTTTNSWF